MPHSYYQTPSILERLISAATYVFPLIGFVFIIIAVLMKKDMKPFLKFHIYQSIFIAFALWLLVTGLGFALGLVSYIPIVKNIVSMITFYLNLPLFFGFSVITLVYFIFLVYLITGALIGRKSYVPWVSDIISVNLRGQL